MVKVKAIPKGRGGVSMENDELLGIIEAEIQLIENHLDYLKSLIKQARQSPAEPETKTNPNDLHRKE